MAFPFRKPVKRERSWRLSTLCASCAGLASLSRQGIREFELRNRVTYSASTRQFSRSKSARHAARPRLLLLGGCGRIGTAAAVHLMKRAPGPLEVRFF